MPLPLGSILVVAWHQRNCNYGVGARKRPQAASRALPHKGSEPGGIPCSGLFLCPSAKPMRGNGAGSSFPLLLTRLRFPPVLSRDLFSNHAPDLIVTALLQLRAPPLPPAPKACDQSAEPCRSSRAVAHLNSSRLFPATTARSPAHAKANCLRKTGSEGRMVFGGHRVIAAEIPPGAVVVWVGAMRPRQMSP
jgi:hypothetical protein